MILMPISYCWEGILMLIQSLVRTGKSHPLWIIVQKHMQEQNGTTLHTTPGATPEIRLQEVTVIILVINVKDELTIFFMKTRKPEYFELSTHFYGIIEPRIKINQSTISPTKKVLVSYSDHQPIQSYIIIHDKRQHVKDA